LRGQPDLAGMYRVDAHSHKASWLGNRSTRAPWAPLLSRSTCPTSCRR